MGAGGEDSGGGARYGGLCSSLVLDDMGTVSDVVPPWLWLDDISLVRRERLVKAIDTEQARDTFSYGNSCLWGARYFISMTLGRSLYMCFGLLQIVSLDTAEQKRDPGGDSARRTIDTRQSNDREF